LNKANLQNPIKHRQYRAQLYNRFTNRTEQKKINEEWENIKTIIESAEETTQSQKKKSPKYEWRDEEYRQAITHMTIARMKRLQQNT